MLGLSSSSSSGSPSLSLPAPYRRGILSGCAALDEAPGSSWLLSALSLVSLPKTMEEDRDAWRAFGIATCSSLRGGAFGNCRLPIKRTWLQVEPYYPSSRYTPLPLMLPPPGQPSATAHFSSRALSGVCSRALPPAYLLQRPTGLISCRSPNRGRLRQPQPAAIIPARPSCLWSMRSMRRRYWRRYWRRSLLWPFRPQAAAWRRRHKPCCRAPRLCSPA